MSATFKSPIVAEVNGVPISEFVVDLVRAQANHCMAEGCWPAPPSNSGFASISEGGDDDRL